ncbi:MAG: hypothetical protein Q4D60_07825 [Eubacteriales bacterium]|nr:hypothetical protein [Eubacteriales bacterium]
MGIHAGKKVMLGICIFGGCFMAAVLPTSALSIRDAIQIRTGAERVPLQSKKMTQKNWYRKVLKKKKGKYKVLCWNYDSSYKYKKIQTKFSHYSHYKIMDINGDGTKELLLSTNDTGQGYEAEVLILTYYNGKVKPVIAFDSLRSGLFVRDNKIYAQAGGSTESMLCGYKMKKGKAKRFLVLERLRRWVNGDYAQTHWKNADLISEEEYYGEWEETIAYRQPVAFKEIQP